MKMNKPLNKYIDHTLLKADSTQKQIQTLCEEAIRYDFMSVCVNTTWTRFCAEQLKDSTVLVCNVVGFPLGANSTQAKAFETEQALNDGADEFDMVMNIGALKDQNYELVTRDIEAVVEAAHGKTVKVILETCLLSDEEIVKACECCVKAKAHFVKTSTGFSTAGANPRVVALMKNCVGDHALVKAAGGVKCYEDMLEMIQAGADRIGTSSGVKLLNKENANSSY